MDKDIIVAEDEDVKIIFHFKVFCELLKECMSIYGNTTIENAQQLVKNFHPLQQPISTTDDIVFFSHETFITGQCLLYMVKRIGLYILNVKNCPIAMREMGRKCFISAFVR